MGFDKGFRKYAGILKDNVTGESVNRMVLEGNERGTLHKSVDKIKSTPESDTEEITTVRSYAVYAE